MVKAKTEKGQAFLDAAKKLEDEFKRFRDRRADAERRIGELRGRAEDLHVILASTIDPAEIEKIGAEYKAARAEIDDLELLLVANGRSTLQKRFAALRDSDVAREAAKEYATLHDAVKEDCAHIQFEAKKALEANNRLLQRHPFLAAKNTLSNLREAIV